MSLVDRLSARFRAQFLSQIVTVVAGALLTIVLARLMEPNGYGLLFLAMSVLGSLEVVTKLGIAKSAARYIAEYKESDPDQIRHILLTGLLLNLATIAVVVGALVLTHRRIADLIGEPELAPLLLFGALFLVFEALTTFVRKTLQGFEAIEMAALVTIVERASRPVFAVALVVLGFGALGGLWGYILSFFAAAGVGSVVLYRRFYREHGTDAPMEDGLRRRIAEYTIPLTATSTANVLDKRFDTILVGFFLNPVAVSYYVIGESVVKFVEAPVEALGFTLSPTFGAQKAEGNVGQASRIYETSLVYSMLLYIPAAAGIILTAEPVIDLVFGADYAGAVPVLQVLGLYAILQGVTNLTSNGLDFLGRARARAIAKGVTSVMNVGFNVVLIPLMGVVGAAVATIVTYSIYTLANLIIIHQEFDLHVRDLAGKVARILAITAAMSVAVHLLLGFVGGWPSLVAVVTVGVGVWAVLSILLGLLDPRRVASLLT